MTPLTRRDFLLHSLAAPAAGLFIHRNGVNISNRPFDGDERILVIIQFTGGNDGLNTCIPIEDDLYHRARPGLRIAKGAGVELTKELSLHPELADFGKIYKNGELAIITNVGYPNPDRSHFRSMEIWHCAHTDTKNQTAGWIGKIADHWGARSNAAGALHVGSTEQPLALIGERSVVPSMMNIEKAMIQNRAAVELLKSTAAPPRTAPGAAWIASEAGSAYAFSDHLQKAAANYKSKVNYPTSELGKKLYNIARLIDARLPARIYYLEIDGFDTHANQAQTHRLLMREVNDAVGAFYNDLRSRGAGGRAAILIFSEFGRRLRENASAGTDHGAAAPMFLIGGGVLGGIHGGAPDLAHLDDGDVTMKTDFRAVYASVIRDWLDLDDTAILGGKYEGSRLFS